MPDSIQPTATEATTAKDFASIRKTFTDFDNSKITSEQARAAFQQEWSQAQKDGVDTKIIAQFSQYKNPDGKTASTPDLPTLEYNTTWDKDSVGTNFLLFPKADNSKDSRTVYLDLETGKATFYSYAESSAASEKADSILSPIGDLAVNFFQDQANAKTTESAIKQEINKDQAAGINFSDTATQKMINGFVDKYPDVHMMTLPNGKIGISSSNMISEEKRIEFDPKTGQTTAEDLHLTAKTITESMAKTAAVFAGGGAVYGTAGWGFGVAAGAVIGAVAGTVAGFESGSKKANAVEHSLYSDPTLIFKM